MCTDLETSLAKIRPQSEQEELSEKWNELSTYTLGNYKTDLSFVSRIRPPQVTKSRRFISDLSKYRPVYAPKDFLEVLITLSGYVPFTRE